MSTTIDPRLIEAVNEMAGVAKTSIKGKQYATVATRMELFRKHFGIGWGIQTEMLHSMENEIVNVRAQITNELGLVIASGLAQEDKMLGNINKTSALENAETSAIGRALACLGLLGGEYASAFEMENAIAQQDYVPSPRVRQLQDIRSDIVDTFPPSINQYTFLVPLTTDEQGIDTMFSEIDRIEDPAELTAYWAAIQPLFPEIPEDIVIEVKATFKARSHQLKG